MAGPLGIAQTPGGEELLQDFNIGNILQAVAGAANAPGWAIRSALGEALYRTKLAQAGGEAGFQENLGPQIGMSVVPGLRVANALGAPVKDIAGMIGGEAVNPVNFMGMGAAGTAAQTGQALNWHPRLIKALQFAQTLDEGATATMNATLAAPFKAARAGLEKTPWPSIAPKVNVYEYVDGVPNIRQQPAQNLAEVLLGNAKQGMLKDYVRKLVFMVEQLKQRGHNFEDDMADIQGLGGKAVGSSSPIPLPQFQSVVSERATDVMESLSGIADPRGQIAALEVLNQTELSVARLAEQLAQRKLQAQQALDAGQIDQGKFVELMNDEIRQAHEGLLLVYNAAETTFERTMAKARFGAPLDPAAATAIDQEYQKAIKTWNWHRDRYGKNRAATGGSPEGTFVNQYERVFGYDNPKTGNWNYTSSSALRHAAERSADIVKQIGADAGFGIDDLGISYRRRLNQLGEATTDKFGTLLADLPDDYRQVATHALPEFMREGKALNKSRQAVSEVLQELWENARPGEEYPAFASTPTSSRANLLEHVNSTLQALGLQPVKSSPELLSLVKGKVTDSSVGKLQGAIERFPAGDILSADPYLLMLDTVARRKALTLGVGTNKLSNFIDDTTGGYKELQLLTPTYLITNLMGMLTMGQMEGVSAGRVARELYNNLGRMITGKSVVSSTAENVFNALGKPIPASASMPVSFAEINAVKEMTGKGMTALQRAGALKLGTAGAVLGGTAGALESPSDASLGERGKNIAVGAALFGGFGATIPKQSEFWLTRLGAGMETVAREEALVTGTVNYIQNKLPEMLQMLRADIAQTRPRLEVSKRTIVPGQSAPPIDVQDRVLKEVMETYHGVISKEQLERLLIESAGLSEPAAGAIAAKWDKFVDEAVREGEALAHRIHFDYEKLNNLEQFTKIALPFSTWAMKAFPFFGRHIAAHPVIGTAIYKLQEASEQEVQERGLPGRFKGSVQLPIGSALWSTVLGRPVESHYNLLRGIVPFSDTAKQLEGGQDDEAPLETLRRTIGAFGPSPHPAIDLVLRSWSGDDPARGLIRHAGPLKGATALAGVNRGRGLDVNRPITALEETLRPGSQTNLETMNILKRIDEMALRETGQTISSETAAVGPYVRAKADRQGPVWDKAAAEVAKEKGSQSIAGYVTQFANPQAILTKEEGQIREARKDRALTPEVRDQIYEAARKDPAQKMPAPIVQAVLAASLQMSPAGPDGQPQLPDVVRQRLESGTAADLHWIQGQIAIEETNRNPLIGGYKGSGSPDEVELANLQALYGSLPALMSGDPKYQGQTPEQIRGAAQPLEMLDGVHPSLKQFILGQRGPNNPKAVAGYQKDRRELLLEQNPLLARYMAYLKERRGTGDPKDFLQRDRENRP